MRKQIAGLALSTFFGLTLCAAPQDQTPAAPAPQAQTDSARSAGPRQLDPNRQVRTLAKRLSLSADQQQQILPVLADRDQQLQAIRNDSSLSPKDRHEKMLALRQDSRNKIKARLTQEQKQAYDQMLEQARERHHDRKSQSSDNS